MYCQNCGKGIPNDSKMCPYCGTSVTLIPQKKKVSKLKVGCLTIVAFFVLMGVIGALFGSNSNSPSATQQAQAEKRPLKMGQPFQSDKFEITVTGKEIANRVYDDSGMFYSKPDGVFVVVSLKYKNIAKERNRLDNSAFSLTSKGNTYSPVNIMATGKNIFLDAINPGIEKTGNLYFDVPQDIANDNFDLQLSNSFLSNTFNGKVELYWGGNK